MYSTRKRIRLMTKSASHFLLLPLLFAFGALYAQPKTEYWDKELTKKRSEENYKNGIQHGPFTVWYESGKVAKSGGYHQGKEHGLWTSFYENGKQKGLENYFKGKKEGHWNYWYINGNKAQELVFKNNQEDSIWTS